MGGRCSFPPVTLELIGVEVACLSISLLCLGLAFVFIFIFRAGRNEQMGQERSTAAPNSPSLVGAYPVSFHARVQCSTCVSLDARLLFYAAAQRCRRGRLAQVLHPAPPTIFVPRSF